MLTGGSKKQSDIRLSLQNHSSLNTKKQYSRLQKNNYEKYKNGQADQGIP